MTNQGLAPPGGAGVPFQAGERIMLIDRRERVYLVTLHHHSFVHTHGGQLSHDELIGATEGVRLETSKGMVVHAFRPRLADVILKMPRQAQVIYPKDLGSLLVYSDVFPSSRVLEAGTGSGALTMALCRAVGPDGRVVSYELRPDHREQAISNIEANEGKLPAWLDLRLGDVRDVGSKGESFDRALLDLPEPWETLGALRQVLIPGGVLCAYLPTTIQVHQLVMDLEPGGFLHLETFETLKRSWYVAERSVRPDHRMIGHTGFVTVARRLA
jgi:tRNA (adenine57-N1/adenine58-N1)-methyltransferase